MGIERPTSPGYTPQVDQTQCDTTGLRSQESACIFDETPVRFGDVHDRRYRTGPVAGEAVGSRSGRKQDPSRPFSFRVSLGPGQDFSLTRRVTGPGRCTGVKGWSDQKVERVTGLPPDPLSWTARGSWRRWRL